MLELILSKMLLETQYEDLDQISSLIIVTLLHITVVSYFSVCLKLTV